MSGETLQMAVVLQQLRNEGIAAVAKAMRLYRSELMASGKRHEAEWLVQACLTDEERGATALDGTDLNKIAGELAVLRVQVDGLRRRPLDPTPELLELLRANGVARYKAGDVEIELGPAEPAGMEAWKGAPLDTGSGREGHGRLAPDEPDEPLSPLPPLDEIRQRSADLRRQQAEDRSGVDVTETGK